MGRRRTGLRCLASSDKVNFQRERDPTGSSGFSQVAVDSQTSETTQLLLAWANGESRALEVLTPRIYRELRRIAGSFMNKERNEQTLQATALVHEVYLRLIDVQNVPWQGNAHFFAICAQMMRHPGLKARKMKRVPSCANQVCPAVIGGHCPVNVRLTGIFVPIIATHSLA